MHINFVQYGNVGRWLFCRLRFGARLLGFIDQGDFGEIKCLGLVLGGSSGRQEAFCTLLRRSWGPLRASWDALGGILGSLLAILIVLG